MNEKSIYKKLIDKYNYGDIRSRSKENQFYEKVSSDKVVAKQKPGLKAKSTPRANHKHDYKPVVIWAKNSSDGGIYGYVGNCCSVCGKKETNMIPVIPYLRSLSVRVYMHKNTPIKYYGILKHLWERSDGELIPIDETTFMKTIFLGSSKTVGEIPVEASNEIIEYMNLGYRFVVGDCRDADYFIQKILLNNNYKNVIVYYSGERCRINLGNWEEKYVPADKNSKGYDIYKRKDEQMAIDCDEGFMILNGATRGTMANIERLIALGKECAAAILEKNSDSPENYNVSFQTIINERHFDQLKDYFEKINNR